MKLLLEEMTRDQAREAFDAGALVVLPTGSIEQHGHHLPLVVDTTAVTHVARAAAERASKDVPVVVTPTMHFGVSHHHMDFAGTMSLPSTVYIDVLRELVRGLHHHGARRVILLNGHGGNQSPNGVVVQSLVHDERLDLALGSLSYWSVPITRKDGSRGGISPGHAGHFETSLMLALRPDLVQLDRRRAPLGTLHAIEHAQEHGAFARAGGTTDDASEADAAEGKRVLEEVVAAVADYFIRFYRQTRQM
ncbi:MAG TPA: creatininase family protein [Chloroflexota bacterium]|nr:creatininase family protein [Chloroflexota bacterium]